MVCQRGHRLIRFEWLDCSCGGHRIYVCPMMVGRRRRCGDSVLVPEPTERCEQE